MECQPKVFLSCEDGTTIFGIKTGQKVHIHLRKDEIIRLDAFTITDTIEINLIDKNPGIDCADCGTGSIMPYAPCGEHKVLDPLNKTQYIKGPGVFELSSAAPSGVPYVKVTKVNSVSDIEFCNQVKPACKDTTWTPTGQERCVGNSVQAEETSNCGTSRWTVVRQVTWTETGVTRCENNVVMKQEENDCGTARWTATTTTCGYCPSVRVSCSGQEGYGFHINDPKDPAATVELAPCDGDTSVDSTWIYQTAGPGHTVKVTLCDGVLLGYAANKSDCAPDCGCADQVINVKNNFSPVTNVAAPRVNVASPSVTTNVAAPNVNVASPSVTTNVTPVNNVTMPAPNLVAMQIQDDGSIEATRSDGTVITSNPLPSC